MATVNLLNSPHSTAWNLMTFADIGLIACGGPGSLAYSVLVRLPALLLLFIFLGNRMKWLGGPLAGRPWGLLVLLFGILCWYLLAPWTSVYRGWVLLACLVLMISIEARRTSSVRSPAYSGS